MAHEPSSTVSGFSCPVACGPLPWSNLWTRDWTCVSCIGRQILNHWTTREVPRFHPFLWLYNIALYIKFAPLTIFRHIAQLHLSIFILLCTHYHHSSPKCFHLLKLKLCTHLTIIPRFFPFLQSLATVVPCSVHEFDRSRYLMWVESSGMCPFVSSSFHLVQCLQDLPVL